MKLVKLAIVDDHPVVLEGMKAMFEFRPSFSVEGAFSSAHDFLEWLEGGGNADIVISDVRMPGMSGFDLVAELRERRPGLKVILLSGTPLKDERIKAGEIGAGGYFPKTASTAALAAAARLLAEGDETFLSEGYSSALQYLAPREEETLRYMARGMTRDEIAAASGCSPETIKNRIVTIRQKLDVPNSAAAISRAYELGILQA